MQLVVEAFSSAKGALKTISLVYHTTAVSITSSMAHIDDNSFGADTSEISGSDGLPLKSSALDSQRVCSQLGL